MDPQKDYRDFEHAQQVQEYRAIQDLALGSCDLDPSSSILRIEKTLFLHTGSPEVAAPADAATTPC